MDVTSTNLQAAQPIVCPCCGTCPTCGRRFVPPPRDVSPPWQPYNPFPWTPFVPFIQPTYPVQPFWQQTVSCTN